MPYFEACSTAIRTWIGSSPSSGAGRGSRRAGRRPQRTSARLLRQKYDLTIDLQGLLRSGLMTAATRARVRVGMADAREGARWFYTHPVPASRFQLHAVDRVLRVVAALGLEEYEPLFHIPVGEQDRLWARETLASVPRPRLILNLGARWLTKRWPPEHFAEVARRAAAEFGAGLVCVGHAGRSAGRGASRRDCPAAAFGSERPDDVVAACRTGPGVAPLRLQRYRSAAPGRRRGSFRRGYLYLHQPPPDRPLRSHRDHRPELRLVRPSFRKTCNRLECFAELNPDRVWPVVRNCLVRSLESAA